MKKSLVKFSPALTFDSLIKALKNKKLNPATLSEYHKTNPELITQLLSDPEHTDAILKLIIAKKKYDILDLLVTNYSITQHDTFYYLLLDVCDKIVKNKLDWNVLFILVRGTSPNYLHHMMGYLLSLKTFTKQNEAENLLKLFRLIEKKMDIRFKFMKMNNDWGIDTNLLGHALFHNQKPFIEFLLPMYSEQEIEETLKDRYYRLLVSPSQDFHHPFNINDLHLELRKNAANTGYNWFFYISKSSFYQSKVVLPYGYEYLQRLGETLKDIGKNWLKGELQPDPTLFARVIKLEGIGQTFNKKYMDVLKLSSNKLTKDLPPIIKIIDAAIKAAKQGQPERPVREFLSDLLTPIENLLSLIVPQHDDRLKDSYLYKECVKKLRELRNIIAKIALEQIEDLMREPKKTFNLIDKIIKGGTTLFNQETKVIIFEFVKLQALLAQGLNFEALEIYEEIMSQDRIFTDAELELMISMQRKLINVFSLKIMENFECFTYEQYRALQTLTSNLNGEISPEVENFNNDISIILRIKLHFKHKTQLITDHLKDNNIDETKFQEILQEIRESDVRRQEEILKQFFIPIPDSPGRVISSLFYQIFTSFIKNIISSLEEAKLKEEIQLAEEVKLNSPLRVAKMNLLIKELKEQTGRLLYPIYFPPLNREINEKEYEDLRQQWITIPELTNEAKDNFHNLDEVNTQEEMTLEDTSLQATANMYPSLSNDPSDLVTVSLPTYEESILFATQQDNHSNPEYIEQSFAYGQSNEIEPERFSYQDPPVASTDIPNPATVAQGFFSDNVLNLVTNLLVCEDPLENNQGKKADPTKPSSARQALTA